MQALFSAKQETASGIYPASGITPGYLTSPAFNSGLSSTKLDFQEIM